MKKLCYLLLLIAVCMLTPVRWSTMSDQILAMESSLRMSEKTLYTYIQDREFLSILYATCPEDAIVASEKTVSRLLDILTRRYAAMNDAEVVVDSLQLWNNFQRLHSIPYTNDATLCLRKTMLYRMQAWLRERHIALLETYDVIDDFSNEAVPFAGYALKKAILENFLKKKQYGSDYALTVTLKNKDFLESYTREEQILALLNKKVIEQAIQWVLYNFKKKWWFTQRDVDSVRKNVVLEFVDECSSFHGSYEVRQTFSSSAKVLKTETLSFTLKVPTCTKLYITLGLPEIYTELIYHEMGHHVWWYKDKDPSRFSLLCRTADGDRNKRCSSEDFVSEYAQTLPEEDYAESFQQRVLWKQSKGTTATKLRYFETFFSQ